MILQALNQLYERRQGAQSSNEQAPAPFGLKYHPIPFAIELNKDGRFVLLLDLRTIPSGKRLLPVPILIPMPKGRSGTGAWKQPNLLWDHYGFLLGHPKSENSKDIEDAKKQNASFMGLVTELCNRFPENESFEAVRRFLGSDQERGKVFSDPIWPDCNAIKGCNLTFRISGSGDFVCQHHDAISFASCGAQEADQEVETIHGACLVTGELLPIARLHPSVSGVASKPTPLVAANTGEMPSASSYGKSQGFVFPVSEAAAFKYATALNDLLAHGSRQRIRVGDASVVFWAEAPSSLEDDFYFVFGDLAKDDPSRDVERVKAAYESFLSGRSLQQQDSESRFYVLGLAPNSGRIAVRFWHVDTVAKVSERITQHFRDIAIVHGPRDPDTLSLPRLLASCAVLGKADKVPPSLGGEVIRAILTGAPYPVTWLQAAVHRCRIPKKDPKGRSLPIVSYELAAVIKACLNRSTRLRATDEKEFTVSLDINHPNVAYRLGRLFATLEKIQEEASPGLNATIRERYYGAASSAPVTVFTTLLRLKNHHLAKHPSLGRVINLERLIGEIMSGITDFPAQLPLAEQGRFAIGYYHQRQSFFTKHESVNEPLENPA